MKIDENSDQCAYWHCCIRSSIHTGRQINQYAQWIRPISVLDEWNTIKYRYWTIFNQYRCWLIQYPYWFSVHMGANIYTALLISRHNIPILLLSPIKEELIFPKKWSIAVFCHFGAPALCLLSRISIRPASHSHANTHSQFSIPTPSNTTMEQ